MAGLFDYITSSLRDTSAGAIEGAVGLVDLASQGGAYLYNKATGRNIEPLQYGPMVSDALDLNPDRDSAAYIGGSLVGGALTGGAGAIRSGLQAGAKEGAKAAGTSLAAEAAGYAGSVGAARAAEAAGYGETGQMVAGLAGGLAAGARVPIGNAPSAMGMADRTDRSAMGVGKSKRRVGTTGKYVGAPDWVDSPQALAKMRRDYIQAVETGVQGADWYDDSSRFLQQVTPQIMEPQQVGDTIGVTSQGTPVDANLGFTVKGFNQRAAGEPVSTGRFPGTQSPLIEKILDGDAPDLGPKRTPFASNVGVAWNPERAIHPVHDIWDGRAFGYRHPDGKPWDAGFSPQQHAFMDEEAKVIIGMLNDKKVGGRTDWDALKAQAAAWTGAKIMAGDVKPEDAAKHYGSYSAKYTANATSEQIPGAGTGVLEGIVDAPLSDRMAYTNDPRSSWRNEAGQDRLYSGAGLLTEPSNTMVGAYTPEGTGVLEINPGEVSRPLVQMETVDGQRVISPRDRGILDTAESSRAYVDAQNAGAWHKVVPGAKGGEQTSVFVNMDASPAPETMAALSDFASRNGMFAVDTGKGVSLINDPWSDIGANRTGASLGKELKGDFNSELLAIVGDNVKVDRVKIETGYLDYEEAWRAGQGSGKATAQFLEALDDSPALREKLEPELRRKAQMNMERDAEVAARTGMPLRDDVQEARRILAEEGLNGLRAAMLKGALLPAVAAAAIFLPTLFSDENDDSQMENI